VEKEGKGYEVVGDTLREVDVYRVRSPLLEKAASRAVEKATEFKGKIREAKERATWWGIEDLQKAGLEDALRIEQRLSRDFWRGKEARKIGRQRPKRAEVKPGREIGVGEGLIAEAKARPELEGRVRARVRALPIVVPRVRPGKGYKIWQKGLERGRPMMVIGEKPKGIIGGRQTGLPGISQMIGRGTWGGEKPGETSIPVESPIDLQSPLEAQDIYYLQEPRLRQKLKLKTPQPLGGKSKSKGEKRSPRPGRRYRIKDVWRIGVKGKKIEGFLFGEKKRKKKWEDSITWGRRR
jgi:hypothetical protein